jgi:hypothetical protein
MRALGYTPPELRETASRIGLLCFRTEDEAVVMWVTRVVGGLVGRGEGSSPLLPFRLHALFLDTKAGRLRARRDWPTASDRSRIMRSAEGKFLLVTPDRLVLYSQEMAPLKELELKLSRDSVPGSFTPLASPCGRNLLIRSELPGGTEDLYYWVETSTLRVIQRWTEVYFRHVYTQDISDAGRTILLGPGRKPEGALYIGKPGDPLDRLSLVCDGYGLDAAFVSDDSWFGWSSPSKLGRFRIHLARTDGTTIFDEELLHDEVIRPFYPAVGGQRFAIAVYRGKGGSRLLDIAPRFSLNRIMVYDLPSRQWIYTLYAKRRGIESVSAFALSPGGLKLALIDQDGMVQVYRLPPESIAQSAFSCMRIGASSGR